MEQYSVQKLIFFSLPYLTALGWIILLSWIVGAESIWIVRTLSLVTGYILFNKLKTVSWNKNDLRWLVAPVFCFFTCNLSTVVGLHNCLAGRFVSPVPVLEFFPVIPNGSPTEFIFLDHRLSLRYSHSNFYLKVK